MTGKSEPRKAKSRFGEEGSDRRAADNNPRKRARHHMRNLLVAGATSVYACDGPVVCDPLPPSVDCAADPTSTEIGWATNKRAVWTTRKKLPVIHVRLSFFDAAGSLTFVSDPIVEGGNLHDVNREPRSMQLWIRPGDEAPEIKITLPLDCQGRPERLVLCLRQDSPPSEGTSVPITVCE